MSKLIIHCTDSEGYAVDFVTTPAKGQKLVDTLPMVKKWLHDNGLQQIKPGTSNVSSMPIKPDKPKVEIDGKTCPKCNGRVWDNRQRIAEGKFSSKSPDFACEDKDCKWAVWKDGYILK